MPVLLVRQRRGWEDANLPILGSLLGLDVVLLLTQLHLESRTFSLKEIYLSLPYSENAIRLHLQKLERGGWVKREKVGGDRRFRAIRPTWKFERAIDSYARLLVGHPQRADVAETIIPSRHRGRTAHDSADA